MLIISLLYLLQQNNIKKGENTKAQGVGFGFFGRYKNVTVLRKHDGKQSNEMCMTTTVITSREKKQSINKNLVLFSPRQDKKNELSDPVKSS